MSRERLPQRRGHELVNFDHGGFRYTAGIGRFDDGRVGEVFLNVSVKAGTPLEAAARDSAIVASLAFQHGVTVAEVRHALTRNADGSASGALGTLLDMLAADELTVIDGGRP